MSGAEVRRAMSVDRPSLTRQVMGKGGHGCINDDGRAAMQHRSWSDATNSEHREQHNNNNNNNNNSTRRAEQQTPHSDHKERYFQHADAPPAATHARRATEPNPTQPNPTQLTDISRSALALLLVTRWVWVSTLRHLVPSGRVYLICTCTLGG